MAFANSFRALAVLLSAAVISAPAGAEENEQFLRASLEWHAPANECLDEASLQTGVEKHLGRPVFVSPEQADVGLRVTVEPPLEKLRARVELTIEGEVAGTRDLEAPLGDCAGLRQTAVLIVSMLIDVPREDVESQRAAIVAAKAKKKPPSAAPKKPPRAEPRVESAERTPWNVDAAVFGGAGAGITPAPAFGGGLAGTLTAPSWWSARVGVQIWKGATVSRASGEASFEALSASLGLGPRPFALGSQVLLRGWILGEAGIIVGSANGFVSVGTATRGYSTIGAAIRPELALGRSFFLCLEVQARLLLARPGFTYAAEDGTISVLHRPGAVGADVGIGLGWKIR